MITPRFRPASVIALFGFALAACAGTPGPAQSSGFAQAQGDLAYVCNQDEATVTVIDLESRSIVDEVRLVDLGFSPNAKPHHVVVSPDGSHWYLSMIGENQVVKFDRNNQIVERVEFEVPGMLALDAEAGKVYAGRSMSAVNPPRRIGEFDSGSLASDELDVFFPRPHALDLAPDGSLVYTASLAENQLATLDVSTGDLELTNVEGGHGEHGHMIAHFDVAPDGQTLAATTEMTGLVLFFDLSGDGLPKLDRQVEVSARPWLPVFSSDSRTLYVPQKDANAVSVVDVTSNRVTAVIEHPAISEPHGAALSPDGRYLIVTNNNTKGAYDSTKRTSTGDPVGTAVIIDTRNNEVVGAVEVGANPTGVGIRAAR